jgi:hypothetical protein
MRVSRYIGFALTTALIASTALAADGKRQIGQFSGFEGNEEALGKVIVPALKSANPDDPRLDFTGRELEVGLAMSEMIKTFNHNSAYQHEMNDALVKMTLEFMQYAKKQGKLEEAARVDAMTQFPMLKRVGQLIQMNGKKELALVAITDQTTCFFQLVLQAERSPGMIRYRAPYGHVLEQTRRMGMHDLTEQEIHEQWTIPHIEVWSEVMGVDIEVSEWQEDGMVTLTVPDVVKAMAKI